MDEGELTKLKVGKLLHDLHALGANTHCVGPRCSAPILTCSTVNCGRNFLLPPSQVNELKEKLKDAGLPTTGKKAELVARLLENQTSAGAADTPEVG